VFADRLAKDFHHQIRKSVHHARLVTKTLTASYSITSLAAASSVGGTTRLNVFAVLRLITKSNLLGLCTGRSAGLAPLRMRSMEVVADHHKR
jgi:hypothetical protein